MRRTLLLAAGALAAAALEMPAQQQFAARVAPQFQTFRFGGYDRTISQFALPIAAEMPLFSRMVLEIGTAFAQSKVTDSSSVSQIAGLTDTQLRTNLVFGQDNVVFTGGLTLPTGQSTIPLSKLLAAGQIGSEFLSFAIPSMGAGLAGTGGVALARNFGDWNVGGGVAFRIAGPYEPYQSPDSLPNARFQPGSEVRARLGLDRGIGGSGMLSLGFTYSRFADDDATQAFSDSVARYAFNSGDRFITQAVYSTRAGNAELFLAIWNIVVSKGIGISGETPGQNVLNASAAAGWSFGRLTLEPNFEARLWTIGGVTNVATGTRVGGGVEGMLAAFGVRSRIPVREFALYPSLGVSVGTLGRGDTRSSLTGFKAGLTAHLAR